MAVGTGRLDNKVAIVTGASSGIGRAIAIRFAAEGARVFVADVNVDGGRETAAMIADAGGQATFVEGDVADPQQVQRLVDQAASEGGHLDVLVNNAGIGGGGKRIEDIEIEDFRRVIDVNLMAHYYGAKYAIPHMRRAGGGSIINVSSVYGVIAAPNVGPYSASKGGVIMLTKQLAVDYSHENIRVNCICRGYVDTDLGGRRARMTPDAAAAAHAAREAKAAMQPIGRQAQPDEMAGAAVFLASDDASFVVGSILVADGGESILHNVGPYF
jgi:NAD(P)-dependent dehydrogenase (short-subunit alcohol dehydrogenase family)